MELEKRRDRQIREDKQSDKQRSKQRSDDRGEIFLHGSFSTNCKQTYQTYCAVFYIQMQFFNANYLNSVYHLC